MKQFKLFFLLLVLMSMRSNKASAYDAEIDGIYYNFNYNDYTHENEATVTYSDNNKYSGSIVIPPNVYYYYSTCTVKSIDDGAFSGCYGLTSIEIPDCVTSIGGGAFSGCSNLYSIEIPNSVTSIGEGVFAGCSYLTSITVGGGNAKYDSRNNCNAIIETGSNTLIAGCKNTVIPSSVTSIGDNAFDNCWYLASIEIPNSVTSIGRDAFYGTQWYDNKPNGLVYAGKVAYKYKGTMPSNTSIVLEEGTKGIGASAFYNCDGLTSIDIPSSVTSIGNSAFYDCDGLTSIDIPNSVASIGEEAFAGTPWYNNQPDGLVYAGKVAYRYKGTMPSNTSIVLEEGTKGIGASAFSNRSGLTSIDIPSSVTSIGRSAFENCNNIKTVTLGTPNVGSWFSGITSITTVTLTDGVESISEEAFHDCTGLAITFLQPETPPAVSGEVFPSSTVFVVSNSSLTAYKGAQGWKAWKDRICSSDIAFMDITVAAKNDRSDIHAVIGESNLESVVSLKLTGSINGYDVMLLRDKMPNIRILDLTDASIVASNYEYYTGYTQTYDNVLPAYMFGDQSKWTEVKLPSTLVSIGDRAFYGTNITSIAFPTGIKIIGSEAFSGSSIKSVDLSNSPIESIGNKAFLGCSNLTTVDLSNSSIHSIGDQAFYSCAKLTSIDFSNSSIQSIGNSAFYSCGSLASVDFTNSTIQSIGNSAFACGNSWSSDRNNLKSIDFSNSSIQSIGNNAFSYSIMLTSVDFTNSAIQSIGYEAFKGCERLTSVNLSGCNKLTTIGKDAFNSTKVASIRIPQSVQTIGENAFSSCNSLNDVYVQTVIPRTINSNTFTNASNATLHVPSLSYYNYYWATAWSQFKKIVEDTNPDYFYVDDDLTVESGRATDTPVDADITGTSGIVVQDDNQTFDEVTVSNNGTNSGTLVTENNTTINIINLNITVVKNKWQFLSFPYRVRLADVVAPGFYVFRRYDGAQRASTGGTGWASLAQETEYLEPGVGYIFQSSQSGTLGIRTENPDLSWGSGKTNPLSVYATDNIEHASWNFVGNPMLCYYDIDDLHTTAPLTFWNGSSYVARRPGDDNYQMKPFEAFFLQKPDGLEQLTYDKSGRMTYKQAQEHHNNKNNNARAAERSERFLINLSLTQGQWEDETRVVYNNKKTTAYEPDCDAAKFMSTMSVPQLYAIEGNVQMAIDERPWGEVQLGFIATAEGEHTITATRLGTNVLLRDNLLNVTHDLSLGGYTFTTEAGTFNDRFTLVPESEATDINVLNEKGQMTNDKAVFDLQGRRTTDAAQKGVRIVRKNNETRKIVK